MTKLFISHSSKDDDFVRDLRAALSYHGQEGWIDSRELRGGDPLLTDIQKAIEESSAYAVVVSSHAFESKWVGKELRHALAVRDQRGKDKFPVIPLSLNGTKLGVLEEFFGEEPIYIPVSSEAGGVEAAMNLLLAALGKNLPADVAPTEQPKAEPLEELVLKLTDLKIHEQDGVRRTSARAQLVYQPAKPNQPEVTSAENWRLIAPIGPIEAEELRWYLEKYAIWPSHYFRDRALKVEENLVKWGQLLHDAAIPLVHTDNVMKAWATTDEHADLRFSVYVDTAIEAGAAEAEVKSAREAATLMLALPWELLHDGEDYLFQGARPVRVRRRLPSTKLLDVPVVATPIRILLVTARPEDDSCLYIDHRASALPLIEAMESLPGLVKIHILSPPTLPALRDELGRARKEKKPYHVVHFDGHGIFNREVGLGGLCFENPDDKGKLEKRRHVTVFTSELGPLLRNHRIPLVFLEACQTAQAAKASESVATELLKVGVASVVAMSHSVLVETARRFVEAFYKSLANGDRVGDAMLAGQRELKDNTRLAEVSSAWVNCGWKTGLYRSCIRKRTIRSSSRSRPRSRRRRISGWRWRHASATCRGSRRLGLSVAAVSCSRFSDCCGPKIMRWCGARAAKVRLRSRPNSRAGWFVHNRCIAPRLCRSRYTAICARLSTRSESNWSRKTSLRQAISIRQFRKSNVH